MKEIKCDHCGKTIEGYYPLEKYKNSKDIYQHTFEIAGVVESYDLNINYKWNNPDPTIFKFCSLECLKEFLSDSKNKFER